MEIKNLLTRKLHHQQPSPQLFFALYLTDDVVQAAIWSIQNGQIEILTQGNLVSWDGQHDNSLVQAVDQSLASASASLELESEPNQIIFGLPTSWLDEHNQLLPQKKKLLKSLSHQLDLEPLGFTLFLESLIIYLQQKEGTPLNALLIHLNDLEINLSLVRQSKFVQLETLDRSDDFVVDVETLLKRLDQTTPLPSRIILFNGHHDLQELTQLLNAHNWSQDFNFLHLPKVEALPQDIGIHAVAIAGGLEIAKSLGLLNHQQSAPHQPLTPPTPTPITSPNPKKLEELGFSLDQDQPQPQPESKPSKSSPLKSFQLPRISLTKPKLNLPHLKTFKLPRFSLSTGPFLFVLLALVLVLSSLTAFFWFVPYANLTLYLQPKTIQTHLNLSLDQTTNQGLAPKTFHHQLSASQTIETTGTGLVGDKATGTVTLYNRTSLTKTFSPGTILKANQLKFTLAESVTVASKSTAADYTETPGKAEVKIEATDIGDKYNLPANTEFQVANYSSASFVARNQSPLSGGSSRQVKLVSSHDHQQLYQQLLNQLQSQFDQQIATQSSDQILIKQGFKVIQKDYSHQVGQESDQLSLDLKLDFYGLAYQKQELNELIKNQLQDKIPLGFHTLDDSLEIKLETDHSATQSVKLMAKIALLPDINETKLKSLLKGKSLTQVSQLLHSLIPEFSRADLKLTPKWLPPKLKFLPFNLQRLQLSIQPL